MPTVAEAIGLLREQADGYRRALRDSQVVTLDADTLAAPLEQMIAKLTYRPSDPPPTKDPSPMSYRQAAIDTANVAYNAGDHGAAAQAYAAIYLADEVARIAEALTKPRVAVPEQRLATGYDDPDIHELAVEAHVERLSEQERCLSVITHGDLGGTVRCIRATGHDGQHIGDPSGNHPVTWQDRADEPPAPTPHT